MANLSIAFSDQTVLKAKIHLRKVFIHPLKQI